MRDAEPGASRRRERRIDAPTVALVVVAIVYLRTLAHWVTAGDSGELAAAAVTLGIAHPPGYPLFTLLGWAAAHGVPFGSAIFRVGLVSALAAAAAVAMLVRLGLRLEGVPDAPRPVVAAVLAASGLAAFAATVWSQAVVVEVYALQGLLLMLLLAACEWSLRPGSDPRRTWPLAGLAAGLTLVNHLTGVLLLPCVALALTLGPRPSRDKLLRVLGLTAAATAAPLVLYLYLPLRSLARPAVAWSVIDAWQPFLVHVSARQFHGLWGDQGLRLAELVRFLLRQLPDEASLVLPALAVGGLIRLGRRRPRFAVVSALAAAALVVYNLGYPIPDIASYYLPVILILAVWATAGAAGMVRAATRCGGQRAAWSAAAALGLAVLLPLHGNWALCDRRDDRLVDCSVADTLGPLEPGAVLITNRWDTVSGPALYAQQVQGLRPDVLVLDYGRTAGPDLAAELARRAPDLTDACRSQLAAVRGNAHRAERAEPYDRHAAAVDLASLRRCLLVASCRQRPTYVTNDLYRHPLVAGYQLVAEGMVARVTDRPTLRPLPVDLLRGPCGRPDRVHGPLERIVWDDYRLAYSNRAQLLRGFGRDREAAELERLAAARDCQPSR